jgi:pimeloyl-ACP methyl ester carboxylesterase
MKQKNPVAADSPDSLPIVLVPGLNCSARLYAQQIPALWRFGPVMVADHTRDASIAAIASRILAGAPPVFALAGLSMGGYIAFEIMRQAPQRVAKLALLDTMATPETAELTARRQGPMAMARAGKLIEVADESLVFFVHPSRHGDVALREVVRAMAEETGVEAYLRQQQAIIARPDSRPALAAIRCPTLMLVGEQDRGTPPEMAREIAAGIAGARLVIVPECGHLSTIERPQAVTKALVEWMQA